MTAINYERGFIIFDKSSKSCQGLDKLLEKYPDPAGFVDDGNPATTRFFCGS